MPMQCQMYNPVRANQGLQVLHGCLLFLRSLPLAQPGPLLPAAGERGPGAKGQAERGGGILSACHFEQ